MRFVKLYKLDGINYKNVCEFVSKTIYKFKVSEFVTEKEYYIYKSWKQFLKLNLLNGFHVPCITHILR